MKMSMETVTPYQFLAQGSAPGERGEDEAEEELIGSSGTKVEGEQYMNNG